MNRPLRRNDTGPWAAIDAAKAAWDTQRWELDERLAELGVRRRVRDDLRLPIVEINEHGVLVVDLGLGVRITGHDAATLLAAVPGGLVRLATERKARKLRRQKVLAARAEKAERLERLKRELNWGAR